MANQIFGQDTNTGVDDHNYAVVNDDGSLLTQQAPGTTGDVIITDPDTGDQAKVNDDGQLHIVAEGHFCPILAKKRGPMKFKGSKFISKFVKNGRMRKVIERSYTFTQYIFAENFIEIHERVSNL